MRRIAASAALALALLDVTTVGVLLPTLRTDLGSSPSGGQWIMNAYLLALALVLPLALRARVDRRLVVAAGAVALAVGGALCATADSTAALVAGRAIAGAGVGALIVPVPGIQAALLPLATLAIGPLVGGELAEHNWWHLWFWAAIPAAVVLVATGLLGEGDEELERERAEHADERPGREEHIREQRAEDGPLGGFLAQPLVVEATAVLLIVLAVQSEPWGLGTRYGVALCGVFALLLLTAFRGPARAAWLAAGGALASLTFLLPQYFELGHLIHPLRSGARLSVLTVAAVAGGLLGAWLCGRHSNRRLAYAGATAAGAGAAALFLLDEQSGNALFGIGMLLAGGGFGLAAGSAHDGRIGELLVQAATGAAFVLAFTGAQFQHVQSELRSSGESFDHALSRGVAEGALLLLPLAIGVAAAVWRSTRESSAAPRAAES